MANAEVWNSAGYVGLIRRCVQVGRLH